MNELLYTAQDLAIILIGMDLDCRIESAVMDLNLFFKSVRIRCLYGMGKEYVRIKLRTLLAVYGYRRRSRLLIRHMQRCMEFYHLKATLRGGTDCDLSTCSLDQMLTFRVE